MLNAYALAVLAAVLPGCTTPAATWKGTVEWPNDDASKNIAPFLEAGAALAVAAAIHGVVTQSLLG